MRRIVDRPAGTHRRNVYVSAPGTRRQVRFPRKRATGRRTPCLGHHSGVSGAASPFVCRLEDNKGASRCATELAAVGAEM